MKERKGGIYRFLLLLKLYFYMVQLCRLFFILSSIIRSIGTLELTAVSDSNVKRRTRVELMFQWRDGADIPIESFTSEGCKLFQNTTGKLIYIYI
jgi:hypothetical protein